MVGAKVSRICTFFLAAALLLGSTANANAQELATAKENPTAIDKEEALKHYRAGTAFYRDPSGPRCEEALPEFRQAYELSGSLNALRNMGICSMLLELDGDAIGYFERFIDKKGENIEEDEKTQVTRDLTALKSAVAWVTLSSDRPAADLLDERTPSRGALVRNSYKVGLANKRFGIHPGRHTFTATAEGFDKQTWTIELKNGGSYNHEFVFDKNAPVTADGMKPGELGGGSAPQPGGSGDSADEGGNRPVPAYVWIAGGVTIASAATMGVMMGLAASKKSTYDSEIRGIMPLAEQESAKSDVETFNLLSDVFIGVTAAGAVTTLVLLLTRPTVPDDEAAAAGYGVDWTLAPAVGPQGNGGVMFSATF